MSMSVSQNINTDAYTASSKITEQSQPAAPERSSSETEPSRYDHITKDGDTLKISTESKLKANSNAKILISDASLANFSKSKIRQLYSKKEITKQQYDKALKSKVQ